jgi:hypothetical protein
VSATSEGISQDIGEGRTRSVPISIIYRSLIYTKDVQAIRWHKMLFRFIDIQENAEFIINNWFDAYDQFDSALNLYFSTKLGVYKYWDAKFLALAQGLETYHRRTSNQKRMEDSTFAELTKQLIEQCPAEHKDWLGGRLKYGNELSLRQRIKRLIKPFENIIEKNWRIDKLVSSIVDTRNYLTHYDESLKSKAATGKELLILCQKMEVIFQLHLLQVLGFTKSEIKSVVENN